MKFYLNYNNMVIIVVKIKFFTPSSVFVFKHFSFNQYFEHKKQKYIEKEIN